MASVAHQKAIMITTPATCQASIVRPAGGVVNNVREKKNRPVKKPIDLGLIRSVIQKKRREINRALSYEV